MPSPIFKSHKTGPSLEILERDMKAFVRKRDWRETAKQISVTMNLVTTLLLLLHTTAEFLTIDFADLDRDFTN